MISHLLQISLEHLPLVKDSRDDDIARVVNAKRDQVARPADGGLGLRLRAPLQVIDEIPGAHVVDCVDADSTGISRKVLQRAIENFTIPLAGTPAEILATAA